MPVEVEREKEKSSPIYRIRGGTVATENRVFKGEVLTACGKVWRVGVEAEPNLDQKAEDLDATGAYVCPGFIDQHTHGAFGHMADDFGPQTLKALAKNFFRTGATGFLPTTITMPHERLLMFVKAAAESWDGDSGPILGIHLEGPYVNPKMLGAQNLRFVSLPDLAEMQELASIKPGLIRIVTLAPELAGATAMIESMVEHGITASMGHTDASYDEALTAVDRGVRCATHIFNAMHPIHHRDPGVVLAALQSPGVFAELICDGIHLHPAIVKMVVDAKGPDRTILVTDSIPAAGLAPGTYELGGLRIITDGESSRLESIGALAGSVLTMNKAVVNVMKFAGVDLAQACRMASLNPARLMGLDHRKGSIAPGKDADITILEPDGSVRMTLHLGEIVYQR